MVVHVRNAPSCAWCGSQGECDCGRKVRNECLGLPPSGFESAPAPEVTIDDWSALFPSPEQEQPPAHHRAVANRQARRNKPEPLGLPDWSSLF